MIIENVYDIRYRENLYYVFPKVIKPKKQENIFKDIKIAIFVNLYYTEELDWYFQYLQNVPAQIDLFIISSKKEIIERAKEEFKQRKAFYTIIKSNRGRDITALLIAIRDYFSCYDYVCFIHDKKWKEPNEKEESMLWRYNLWENMIASEEYIYNLLLFFQKETEVGLLCPPEPIGYSMRAWYMPSWSDSFNETHNIANKLGLKSFVTEEKPPVSLSTVFWCRTDALKKLIEYPWKYEDFPEEPLPQSGTINHGIERVLAHVAQDAGYKTGIVMTDEYAEYLIGFSQYQFQYTFSFLYETLGIKTLQQLYKIREQKQKVMSFFANHNDVYLYGAGIVGKRALKCLRAWNCLPKGFVVSENQKMTTYEDTPLLPLSRIEWKQDDGIIVTVSEKYRKEILNRLKEKSIQEIIIWEA